MLGSIKTSLSNLIRYLWASLRRDEQILERDFSSYTLYATELIIILVLLYTGVAAFIVTKRPDIIDKIPVVGDAISEAIGTVGGGGDADNDGIADNVDPDGGTGTINNGNNGSGGGGTGGGGGEEGGGGGNQQSTSDLLASIGGAYWGTNGAGLALEPIVGRTFDLQRTYYGFGDSIPTQAETDTINAGRIPLISLFPGIRGQGGSVTYIPWADIAAGQQDSYLSARAEALKSWGYPIFMIFNHEPSNDTQNLGTSSEFVSAWQHIYNLFKDHGSSNVVFVFNIFGSSYQHQNIIDAWYPGDSYVDWVSADGYNFYDCKPSNSWPSFQTIFQQFYDFSVSHNKPALIAEWGSEDDSADPNRRAQWFTDAGSIIKSWPNLKGLTYYDNDNSGSDGCNWKIDNDPASVNAFKAISQDPYFNPNRPF